MIQAGIQMCFCGPGCTALPAEPLDAHDHICLIWDWAMAHGRVSPQRRLAQLDESSRDLGLSDAEMAREEAGLRWPAPLRDVFPRWHSGRVCYPLPSGNMVHVKPGCRCR